MARTSDDGTDTQTTLDAFAPRPIADGGAASFDAYEFDAGDRVRVDWSEGMGPRDEVVGVVEDIALSGDEVVVSVVDYTDGEFSNGRTYDAAPEWLEVIDPADLTGAHFDPETEAVTDAWEGVCLTCSWGYNQTNVDFAMITEVSTSGKTVVCQRVTADRVDVEQGSERLRPGRETFGDEFRLHVRDENGDPRFRGTYPMSDSDGDMDGPTRKGHFRPFFASGGDTVHQTPHGYRH